jgi:hypothetical protein
MASSAFPYLSPNPQGGLPPLPFPVTCIGNDKLVQAAARFPNDFAVPKGCRLIWFSFAVPNYLGTDVISFQFNGDSTSGTYWDNSDTSAAVSASGDTTPTGTKRAAVSANVIRLGFATNKWRVGWGQIINFPTKEKGVSATVQIGSSAAPGTTNVLHGATAGGWDGTAPSLEINTIRVLTAGGVKMGAESQIAFFAQM